MKTINHGHIAGRLTFLILFFLMLFPAALSGVEAFSEDIEQATLEPEKPFLFFTLGPVGMLNTDKLSAPSPIKFSLGVGGTFPVNNWFAFSPSMTLFTDYYLWRNDTAGGRAYPAEVENRTALVPSALIELPAVFYTRNESGSSTFSLGLGVTLFARLAFLADGVPQAEADDIKSINSFFYSGLRFIYPSAYLAYDHTTESGLKAGVMLRAWLPLASLAESRGLDGGMASIAFRLSLAKPSVEQVTLDEPAETK